MQKKLLAVFAFVLLALVGLLSRITYITAKSGNQYAKQVLSQQSYDSQTIPCRRGQILDRNGIILAKSDLVYNVVLDCKQINSDETFIEPTIRAVCANFGLEEAVVRDRIQNEKTRESQYQVIVKKVTEEQKEAFDAYVYTGEDREISDTQREELERVQGVWFEEQYDRDYPYDTLASNVIGFSNDLDQGVVGVESYYNSLLNGTNGRVYGYLNSSSEFQKTTIEPEHGKNLVLTLDMNIQQIVEKYIAEFDKEYGEDETRDKGAENIGVVVMNPNNGEILGMACNSTFNLNDPQDLMNYYTASEIKRMDDRTYVETLNRMWSNFCVSDSFEPGSVVKPITVASALEVGAITDDSKFYCDGGEYITDTQINCDYVAGHKEETLADAIKNSCNDALMQIGMKMGITNFVNSQRTYNFGATTGIDLPNENPGVVYNRDTMHEVELATCTFGQGYTCNMIQEIAAFSAVINGGYYYQPHVLKQVLSPDGTVEKTVDALKLKQPCSSGVSALIRSYLTVAVQEGTGRKSQVPGYLTGGKTGTAEKINPETGRRASGKYLLSFIGACPMDNPQIVIYVVIDEPNIPDQEDSSHPQVVFRKIATEVFPYIGLYPTQDVSPELLAYLGLTESDVVEGDIRIVSDTFAAFDINGYYYTGAHLNDDGVPVSEDGEPLEGVTVDLENGVVTDAFGNQFNVKISKEQKPDPVADNPDIAAPPEAVDGGAGTGTVWAGVTDEDLAWNEAGMEGY